MTAKTPAASALTRRRSQTSEVGLLAAQIRHAADYLISKHGYNWDDLSNITGGCDLKGKGGRQSERLHINSLMKLPDLWFGYAVKLEQSAKKPPKTNAKDREIWIRATEGELNPDGTKGRYQWFWNPQLDTFERLERILNEAKRLGFDPATVGRRRPVARSVTAKHRSADDRVADEARAA